jgi:hypothetical protein
MSSLDREDRIPTGHCQSRTPETTVKTPMVLKAAPDTLPKFSQARWRLIFDCKHDFFSNPV